MDILYTAQVTATGARNGKVKSSDNVLDLDVRMPKGLGGEGGAFTNPEQLFAAGYSACFDGALGLVAKNMNVPIKDSEVTAKVSIGKSSDGLGLSVELLVKIPNLEKSKAEELVEAAHKVCPYSKATRGNVDVKLSVI